MWTHVEWPVSLSVGRSGPKILIVLMTILTSGNKIRTGSRDYAHVYNSAHDFMSILNSQFLLKAILFTSHGYLFYFLNS